MSFDALLFDFDGVLADTERHHHATWNATLAPFGIQFTWPEYLAQCVGIADKIVAERLNLPDQPAVVAEKQARFRKSIEENPPFHPETIALIQDLSRTHRLAVVSSSYRSEIVPSIERAGLAPCFESIICGDDVQRLKPAPDPYLLAVERLQPRKALVIEDSEAGIAAGEAAGLEVLRITAVERMPELLRERLSQKL